MSDIVERAQAALKVLEAEAAKPSAIDAASMFELTFNLIRAASVLPGLIAEVNELRTELKWVNA